MWGTINKIIDHCFGILSDDRKKKKQQKPREMDVRKSARGTDISNFSLYSEYQRLLYTVFMQKKGKLVLDRCCFIDFIWALGNLTAEVQIICTSIYINKNFHC